MVTVLRRGKLFDTASVGALLLAFTLIPVVLLLRSKISMLEPAMQAAKIALLGISWPFLVFGSVTLYIFWYKGRSVDKHYFSTATPRQLNYVMAGTMCVFFGSVLIFVSEILSLVDRIQQYPTWRIVIDVIVLLLLGFVAHSLFAFTREIRQAKRSVDEIAAAQQGGAANIPASGNWGATNQPTVV